MTNQLLLRFAQQGDWKGIFDLYDSLSKEDRDLRFLHPYLFSKRDARELSNNKGHTTIVALVRNKVIGEASLANNGEISIVVAKEHRGSSIGLSLMKELIALAEGKGFRALRFYALASNLSMIALGKRLGFRQISILGEDQEWVKYLNIVEQKLS